MIYSEFAAEMEMLCVNVTWTGYRRPGSPYHDHNDFHKDLIIRGRKVSDYQSGYPLERLNSSLIVDELGRVYKQGSSKDKVQLLFWIKLFRKRLVL